MSADASQNRVDDPASLLSVLASFRNRWFRITGVRTLVWTLVGIVAVWILAMWVDLIVSLSTEIRWSVSRWTPIAIVLTGAVVFLVRAFRQSHVRVAQEIDEAKQTGGEIESALQLSSQPVNPQTPLARGLAQIAVDRSSRAAARFPTHEVYPADSLVRPTLMLMGIVAAVGVVALIVPGIVRTQMERFLNPSADVPPYTGVTIELQMEAEEVLYGDNLLVTAVSRGGRVDRMQLVTRTEAGDENVLPMLSASSGSTVDGDAQSQWQAMLSKVTEPLTLYARSGRSRSQLQELGVILAPQLLPPAVRITPPAYTNGGTYEGSLPEQGITGLAGTQVSWRLSSNRPLSSGVVSLTFRDGTTESIALQPDDDLESSFGREAPRESSSVFGKMELSRPAQFVLSVTDVDGIESQETIEGNIAIITDQRPIVRITSPRPVSVATPNVRLPVRVEGADDFGITRMSLFRSLNGSPASEMDLEIDGTNRQLTKWTMPLDQYGLVPGDEIQLFARIEDNDPSGAKGSESPVTIVKIISQADFHSLMMRREGARSLQAKYSAARRQMEQLAEALRRVEETAQAAADPNATDEQKAALNEELAKAIESAERTAESMKQLAQDAMPIDVDQELAKRLAEQAERIQEMAEQLSKMSAEDPSDQEPLSEAEKEMIREMAEKLAAERNDLQKNSIEPLGEMQKIMPLVVDQQRFVQIVRQQRDLERRLSALRAAEEPDQKRIAELESEQQLLRETLDTLLDDIEQHVEDLPDNPDLDELRETALQFVDDVRASEADAKMAGAQQNLLNNEFDEAHDDAKTAADILESFLSQCDGMGNKACENCKMAFNPGAGGANLGNSIQQMLAMMGMKPGASGAQPGGNPGMGMGWGAGGGYSQRMQGPNNVGMYGAMPSMPQSANRGRGDNASSGAESIASGQAGGGQSGFREGRPSSESAGGQGQQTIPSKYRDKVSQYLRQLAENQGE